MPQRPDLRELVGNIRDSLADCDRDTLLAILTFVFKEYLVEGPPPMIADQVERLPDLENLSFGQLISALQTRLDHPELALFQVDGDRVMVRVGGVMQPLTSQRTRAPGDPQMPAGRQPATQPAAPPLPEEFIDTRTGRPVPGVRVVETGLVQRPPGAMPPGSGPRRGDVAGMARQAVDQAMQDEGRTPPPRGGLSIRGRSSGGSFMPGQGQARQGAQEPAGGQAPGQPGGQQAGSPEEGQKPGERPGEPEHPGEEDGAATRFSLLELD